MKLQKQQVYLPIELENELPKGQVCAINGKGDMLVGYIREDNDSECESNYEVLPLPEYWLKKEYRFVFSEEEFRGLVKKIFFDARAEEEFIPMIGMGGFVYKNKDDYIDNLLK